MQRQQYFYIIGLQYLGFRFHGWQKQPEVKTVEKMVERTFSYILERAYFKVIASGRTDAKVSVNQTYIELIVEKEIDDLAAFLMLFNQNLPQDIRALSIEPTTKDFNIIKHAKRKEYHYVFSFGEKNHPFAAPFIHNAPHNLSIELMQEAAQLFTGEHDFWSFCYKPKAETQTVFEIQEAEIIENTIYQANFFPRKSYLFRVEGKGFKRQQIRLMMGMLLDIGEHQKTMEDLKNALDGTQRIKLERIAPPSGLILHRVELKS